MEEVTPPHQKRIHGGGMSVYPEIENMEDYLPCPFCGSKDLLEYKADYDAPTYQIQCNNCEMAGPYPRKHCGKSAKELWNERMND